LFHLWYKSYLKGKQLAIFTCPFILCACLKNKTFYVNTCGGRQASTAFPLSKSKSFHPIFIKRGEYVGGHNISTKFYNQPSRMSCSQKCCHYHWIEHKYDGCILCQFGNLVNILMYFVHFNFIYIKKKETFSSAFSFSPRCA